MSFAAFAQSETEVYTTYDGLISFALPAGWVVDSEGDVSGLGFFSLASSEDALSVLQDNSQRSVADPMPAGAVGVIVFRWDYLMERFGVGKPGDAPADTLQVMFGEQLDLLDIEIRAAAVGSYPAATFTAADERGVGAVYALDLGSGGVIVFGFSTVTEDDYAKWEPAVFYILESLEFGGDANIHYSPTGFFPSRQIWSPDSQTYALVEGYRLGEQPQSVALYNVAGEQLAEIAGLGTAWNSDGSQAALFGDPSSSAVPIVDTVTGETFFTLGTAATNVRWSPDDRYIIAGDLRQALRIWDAADGRQLYSSAPAQFWAFNADESLLAAWNYGGTEVLVIDMGSGAELWTAPRAEGFFDAGEGVPEVSWSSDGGHLLVIAPDGTPALLNATSGAVTASYLPPPGIEFDNVMWGADDLVLAFRSADCRIGNCQAEAVVIDARSGDARFRLLQPYPIGAAVWSPDGTRLVTGTNFEVLNVAMWDAETGALLWETPLDVSVSFSIGLDWIDDAYVLAVGAGNTALLLDAASGDVTNLFPQNGRIDDIVLKADRSQMLVVGASIVRVRNVSDGAQIMALPHENELIRASWSADETLIFTITEGGMFSVWDAATGRALVRINDRVSVTESDRSLMAYISPDGQQVGTYLSGSPYTRVWSLGERLDEARARIAAETLTVSDYLDANQTSLEAEDFAAAIEACLRALEIDPDDVRAYNALAIAYYRSGELTQAVDTLNRATEIDPASLSSYRILGDVYRRENSMRAARSAYQDGLEAATVDADRAAFYNRIGLTYSTEQATYADAAEQFTLALELDPTQAIYFRNRGYVSYWQGEALYPQAIADFETFVELAGADADAETVELLATLRGA